MMLNVFDHGIFEASYICGPQPEEAILENCSGPLGVSSSLQAAEFERQMGFEGTEPENCLLTFLGCDSSRKRLSWGGSRGALPVTPDQHIFALFFPFFHLSQSLLQT